MDITPIYELRNRLRAAAIAGTNLLSEDFRLKRAVEGIQPLEAASPVFAKIGELARGLLSSEQADREGALLDTITLVDALLCTQGEVAVAGELQPLRLQSAGAAVSNAPYSDVKAILDALENSGGGRYGYLTQMHEERPELFEDYRVKPALVRALGASYAELAEDVKNWLKNMGEPILPLLERDFDPKGKKEMLRRLEVIDTIAGAGANDFYVRFLPDSEKELRQALIYALRYSQENEELLLSLVKTEKGKAKKLAYCALACMEGDEARACVVALVKKKPEEARTALSVSKTDWVSDLLRQLIFDVMDGLEKETDGGRKLQEKEKIIEAVNELEYYLEALEGKNGRVVGDCCRRVAAFVYKPQIMKLLLEAYTDQKGNFLKHWLAIRVWTYLKHCPDAEMVSLALEMYETYEGILVHDAPSDRPNGLRLSDKLAGETYFPAALLAKLISCEDCTAWLRKEMHKEKNVDNLSAALAGLRWNRGRKTWELEVQSYNSFFEKTDSFVCPIKQRIDGDFLTILIEYMDSKPYSNLERTIVNCIPDNDKNYVDVVMEHFYRKAKSGEGGIYFYCEHLKKHGYPKCEGIAVQHFKKKQKIPMWEIRNILEALPGDAEAKRAEGREVIKQIKNYQIDARLSSEELQQIEDFVETIV
ncbi:MAG: hypothetical protein NC092_07900 [Butyrivibrio sp.]|nr:hypothetical protein [Muribaculum sp.]MCM1552597.1 hypothetical protein [Butyrivibrio sp.]